jgi:formylglycine-generating enzyme required for sulfatase activity
MEQSLYLLRPLSAEKIREVITEPARVKGVSFESDAMVNDLVQSMSQSASLPLLQFALAELWDARSDPRATITASALDAIGGVTGALTRHANRVLLGYSSAERDATRCLLVELVTVDDARARKTESELAKVHTSGREVLHKLVQSRLLVTYEGADEVSYEIAHEALLRDWDTLRLWLDEKNVYRIVERRLANAAVEWVRLGKPRAGLWSDQQLTDAAILDSVAEGAPHWEFIHESRIASRRRRYVRHGVFIGVPTMVILVFAMFRVLTQRELDNKVNVRLDEANGFYTAALTDQGDALRMRREAYASFDARDSAKGEETWTRALIQGSGVDAALGRTLQTLEAALILDSRRTDVRALFGHVLYDRALSAEAEHRLDTQDDLLARMALYDGDGTLKRKWNTAASLSIQTEPPGARIVAHRYALEAGRYMLDSDGKEMGETPLAGATLERGSYMLTTTANGRADVRYPIRVDRGEERAISFRLPMVEDVPQGFIYIPAGRFVFGTAIDETKRKGFLTTVPAHEIESDEYYIAQHEVTYAEYIAYLRTLVPAERLQRMPKINGGLVDSAFGLNESSEGRYRLVFKDSGAPLEAAEGEPLRYPTRKVRVTQDWQKLPISGITAHDAEAYATWLSSSNRVPGARLCTEYEWERGARGADAREYPHGDVLESDDGNHDETYGKDTSAMGPDEVGSHPASRSPFGLDDMAGNVLEWTTSSLESATYVIRSGAYYYDKLTACSTNRSTLSPEIRDARLGVRMCASVLKH